MNKNIINHNKYIEFNTVFELQKLASVNIVIEADTWISPFLPGKIPHLVAADKPILHIGPKISETLRLLGENYDLHTTNSEKSITLLAKKIEDVYYRWKESQNLKLNREDLEKYLRNINI
jgi:hypothetical protein